MPYIQKVRTPLRDVAISLAAQIILVLSGGMFLCGYTARAVLYETLGFTADSVDQPIAETIANGYLLAGLALVAVILIYMIAYLVVALRFLRAVRRHAPRRRLAGRRFRRFKRENMLWVWHRMVTRRFPRRIDPLNAPLFLLLITLGSVLIGAVGGTINAQSYIRTIGNGCRSACFVYLSEKRSVIGRPITGDKDKIFVLTSDGVKVIPTNGLREIAPYPYGAGYQLID